MLPSIAAPHPTSYRAPTCGMRCITLLSLTSAGQQRQVHWTLASSTLSACSARKGRSLEHSCRLATDHGAWHQWLECPRYLVPCTVRLCVRACVFIEAGVRR